MVTVKQLKDLLEKLDQDMQIDLYDWGEDYRPNTPLGYAGIWDGALVLSNENHKKVMGTYNWSNPAISPGGDNMSPSLL